MTPSRRMQQRLLICLMIVVVIIRRRRAHLRPSRALPYGLETLDVMNMHDGVFQKRFRFTKQEAIHMLPYLGLESVQYRNQLLPEPLEVLCLVTSRLSWPRTWIDLADWFGRSPGWLSIVYNDAIEHLYQLWKDNLHWDARYLTADRMRWWAQHIDRANGGNIYWGYIDGSQRKIMRPVVNQRISYSGYKKAHVFNIQSIVTPDGMIQSLAGPYAGIVNDPAMVVRSNLEERLKEIWGSYPIKNRLFLYGDKAYPSKYGILGAYKRRAGSSVLPEQHAASNAALNKCRTSVEHLFGVVANQWMATDFKRQQASGLSPVAATYIVAVVLTNVLNCFRLNQTSKAFDCLPEAPEVYLERLKVQLYSD